MALVVFLGRALFIGVGLQTILAISKYDAWISIILGFIIGFIPILLICYMNKKNVNLFELINSLFNKFFAKIINFIIIVFLLFSLIVLTNDFINFTNVKYLFETPNFVIAILFFIPALFLSHKGVETIGRSGLFLFFISTLILIIICLALFKDIDINNIKPILSKGILPVLKGALYFVVYTTTPILFLSIIPKSDETYKKYNKSLIIGYIISFVSLFLTMFFITTIYNYEYISLFSYPEYFTLKKIDYGFVSNVENILSFYFIIDYFFSMVVLLYSIFYYLSKELNLKENKLKIFSILLTIIIIILSITIYKDTTIALLVSQKPFVIINGIFLLIFLILIPIKIKLHKH